MGARLHYAKVLDREAYMIKGGKLHPGLQNQVIIDDEPGRAAVFVVFRGWGDDHGSFTEQWRIEDPEGQTIYESVPREIHVATNGRVERLEDEVADLDLEFAADDYNVVFTLDEREVARATFAVKLAGR
ncbi:MAG: hypothetical protein M3238_05990 [Actinomycetota bacterium]|nr:hypothetical protein [Actinomycetota bacterium]